jgi:predicted Rossmann-fold nucleotide-binding protein
MDSKTINDVVNIKVTPDGQLDVLSRAEVNKLLDTSQGGLYHLYRRCSLAVLNCGNDVDDAQELLDRYPGFNLRLIPLERGIRIELTDAPAVALVEGKMIEGIKQLLFAVLRDIIYVNTEITGNSAIDMDSNEGITNAVFHILRNADVLTTNTAPNMVVCWGGHSIVGHEYDYSKDVGYEMGLRGLDICTGCGPGAMKGPMKGATIGHSKQRIYPGRYIGISEPGIIAAEPPNPIVNELIIMPDIEKRLEAFVRFGHAICVFPGGVGTVEEILYLLGILLHPDNKSIPFPLIFTGPDASQPYFEQIDRFIAATLGERACSLYKIIVGDAAEVGSHALHEIRRVRKFRNARGDAYYYNWLLSIPDEFQQPFEPTHENMENLQIHHDQEDWALAGELRRCFSALVAGNVKEDGIRAVAQHGNYRITGDPKIMVEMDKMLRGFVEQNRMKLAGKQYVPCYDIVPA